VQSSSPGVGGGVAGWRGVGVAVGPLLQTYLLFHKSRCYYAKTDSTHYNGLRAQKVLPAPGLFCFGIHYTHGCAPIFEQPLAVAINYFRQFMLRL